jgi:hypothetical protein
VECTQNAGWLKGKLNSELTQQRLKLLRIFKYWIRPNKCLFCGITLAYIKKSNKFCSKKCYGNSNRKNISGKLKRIKSAVCLYCGKEFAYDTYTNRGKFCCCLCSSQFMHKQRIIYIEQCGGFKNDNSARTLGKRYLIEKRGHRCEVCGTSKWLGEPVMLILDHIDGDNSNNKITNCRLVCSNCDATLPTYKGRNKGKANRDRTKYKSRY